MVISPLLKLPDELLATILSNLPARSILACGASCSRLRAVIGTWMLLRWRLWSTRHGIQEFSSLGLSLPDLDAEAKRWEIHWLFFGARNKVATRSMRRPSSHGSLSTCPTKYDFLLRSGYLIQVHRRENPGWSHIHLPLLRELRGFIKEPVWTDVRLGDSLTMEGWALDLDQDLVAASLLS